MRKRFLSILTALALALSLLPVTALAAGEPAESLPTPDGNNVYTLSADTTVTSVGWPQTSARVRGRRRCASGSMKNSPFFANK